MPPALAAAFLIGLQAAAPLKKSDLIRLLSSSTIPPAEIAELVRRHCLSFTPSARDKADLRSLGADDAVMRRIDECGRRATGGSAGLRATVGARESLITVGARTVVTVDVRRGDRPAAGVRVVLRGSGAVTGGPDLESTTDERGSARFELRAVVSALGTRRLTVAAAGESLENPPGVDFTVRPAPVVAAPSRTAFVAGIGQRGRVGTRLSLPLVFEARDTANAPVAGQAVKFSAENARLEGAGDATDSTGRVRAWVVLGERAGPVRVMATLGGMTREASLVAVAGPPQRLEVRCGGAALPAPGRIALASGTAATIDIAAVDAFGNRLPLTGLRVSVGDDDVVKVTDVAADSLVGRFALRAGRAGATNLVVLASGVRESVVAAVVTGTGAGATCRATPPRG